MSRRSNNFTVTHSFGGGMNRDIGLSYLKPNSYYYALNFRPVVSNSNTLGWVENIKGNSSFIDTLPSGYYIVGYCNLRDELILFLTQNETSRDLTGNNRIYKVTYIDDTLDTVTKIYEDGGGKGTLDFSREYPIKAVGRHESDSVKKVYWTDYYNNVRYMNIEDSGLSSQLVEKFDIVPDFSMSKPELESIETGGSIRVGSIQYAYQLYSLYGPETFFSPLSDLIHLTDNSEYLSTNKDYEGGNLGDISYKQVRVSFDITDPATSDFDVVKLIAIHYDTINGTPQIRIAGEKSIVEGETNISMTDFGDSLGEYTFEELSILGKSLFKAKDIISKDNRLFASNIKEDYFDLDVDARVFRQNDSGDIYLWNEDGTKYLYCSDWDSGNGTFTEYNNGASGPYYSTTHVVGNQTGDYIDITADEIPEDYDCVNSNIFREYDTVDLGYNECKYYTPTGTTEIGGVGLNISYRIKSYPFMLDQYSTTTGKAMYINSSLEDSSSNPSYRSFASPWMSANKKGYLRGETYRFGIVFFDEKGRSSFVKWIGDIKMPFDVEEQGVDATSTYNDFRTHYIKSSGGDEGVYGASLYVEFDVDFSGTNAEGYDWQIVRVKRESSDRTIVSNGVLSYLNIVNPVSGDDFLRSFFTPYSGDPTDPAIDDTYDDEMLDFTSPEINYKVPINNVGSMKLYALSYSTYDSFTSDDTQTYYKDVFPERVADIFWIKLKSWNSIASGVRVFSGIDDYYLWEYGSPSIKLGITTTSGLKIDPYFVSDGLRRSGLGGTRLILKPSDCDFSSLAFDANNSKVAYGKLVNEITSQYGGQSYERRSINEYIACSDIKDGSSAQTDVAVYGGDTFVCYFDHVRCSADSDAVEDNEDRIASFWYFPVETSLNLDLNRDCAHRYAGANIDTYSFLSEKGNHEKYLKGDLNVDATDYYVYNTVYSQEPTLKKFYPKPINWEQSIIYDTRTYYSDEKYNLEVIDSWLTFRVNNFKDVDSEFGPINNLEKYKDNVYYFQDKAFGVFLINPRSLIQDNNLGALQLGTGSVLDRYNYASTETGNKFLRGVVPTNKAMYWIDGIKKEFVAYSGDASSGQTTKMKEIDLSRIKGIQSYLNQFEGIDDVVGFYDKKYGEVVFTVKPYRLGQVYTNTTDGGVRSIRLYQSFDGDSPTSVNAADNAWIDGIKVQMTDPDLYIYACFDSYLSHLSNGDYIYVSIEKDWFTIAYNEVIKGFSTFYSFIPYFYIRMNNDKILSSDDYNDLYVHDSGDYNTFYGDTYKSEIHIVENNMFPQTKVFDYIEWFNQSDTAGTTFDTIRVINDSQDTGSMTIDSNNSVRKEGGWKMAIPRNSLDSDGTTIDESRKWRERIRDKYSIFKLSHTPSNNESFSLSNIDVLFRASFRIEK